MQWDNCSTQELSPVPEGPQSCRSPSCCIDHYRSVLQRCERASWTASCNSGTSSCSWTSAFLGFLYSIWRGRMYSQNKKTEKQIAHLQNTGQKKRLKVKWDEFAYKGQEGKNRAILTIIIVRSNKGIDVQVLFVCWRPGAGCLFQYGVVPQISCPFLRDMRKHLLNYIKLSIFHEQG